MSVCKKINGELVPVAETVETPIATTETAGKVKPDGTTISVDENGVISSAAEVPIATTEVAGKVKPDGTTITIDQDGTISGADTVPIATTSVPGKVKPDGTTITIDSNGTISGADTVPIATTEVAGKVKPDGSTVTIDSNGTITANSSVPIATTSTVGGVKFSNTKEASVDAAGAFTIDPYFYRLDRRKVFPQGVTPGSGALVGSKQSISNNTIYDLAQVYYSGMYLIKLQSITQEKVQGGILTLTILNGDNAELMSEMFSVYCPCLQGSYTTLATISMIHTVYAIAPLQKGTYAKGKISGAMSGGSSSNNQLILWGTLLYEFTTSTSSTSYWWNNSNIIS